MRRLVLTLALLLLPASAQATTYYVMSDGSSNTTGPADSCEPDDTNATIVFATHGDTVQLGAGTCQWAGDGAAATVVLTLSGGTRKAIRLRGAGTTPTGCDALVTGQTGCGAATSGGTTIRIIDYTACSGNLCDSALAVSEPTVEGPVAGAGVVIENIKFLHEAGAATPSGGITGGMINIAITTGGKPTIIHHNTFSFTGEPTVGSTNTRNSIVSAVSRGVAHSNIFTIDTGTADNVNNASYLDIAVTDNAACSNFFQTASSLGLAGDPNGNLNFYFENNYVYGFQEGYDPNTSARGVVRKNALHNTNVGGHGFDSSICGERHQQIYDNHWYCSGTPDGSWEGQWIHQRGGTRIITDNVWEDYVAGACNSIGATPGRPIDFAMFRIKECVASVGWPGGYPFSHGFGWGWTNPPTHTGVGTPQDLPTGGFSQSLEPTMIFGNDWQGSGPQIFVHSSPFLIGATDGDPSTCRAMAANNFAKSDTPLTLTKYLNADEQAIVVVADLVGGTAPSIASDINNNWVALTGATHGTPNAAGDSMRMSAWCIGSGGNCTKAATAGKMTITITFDSSAKARAGAVAVIRGNTATPKDSNPAVIEDNTDTYTAPSTGVLAQASESVLGYFALNGPAEYNNSTTTTKNDTTFAGSSDAFAKAGLIAGGVGAIGTTGGVADSNVTVAITYRKVAATTAVTPQLRNTTANRNGLAGVVTLKIDGDPDLPASFWIQANREYYHDDATGAASEVDCTASAAATCSKGIGRGTRANRPTTCVAGTGYASTDFPGTLDKCTATDTWTNAWWEKYTYPHPLASLTGGAEGEPAVTPVTSIGGGVKLGGGVILR